VAAEEVVQGQRDQGVDNRAFGIAESPLQRGLQMRGVVGILGPVRAVEVLVAAVRHVEHDRDPGLGATTGLGAALNTAAVIPGSSVAVIGCGGVGQSVIQGARIAGAAVIIAIDPMPGRREASAGVGATHTVDPAAGDPVGQVRALTGGRGADYSFEAVGRPELMVQAFEMACVEAR
jgi:Zn-dependent alcohol dehydrogenase